MRASSQFNPEQLPSLPAGGRSLSNRCASYGVKLALGAGLHRTYRRAIESTRHTHLNPQSGHQASNQFADAAEVTHSVKSLSNRAVLTPEAIEDGFSHAQISFAPGAKAHD